MRKNTFTKVERQVMEIFWSTDKELSIQEILEISPDFKKNTVFVVLRNLLENGYIEISAYTQLSRIYARKYKASVSKEQYYLQIVARDLSVEKLISAAFESSDEEDLEKFEKLLIKAKNKKGI